MRRNRRKNRITEREPQLEDFTVYLDYITAHSEWLDRQSEPTPGQTSGITRLFDEVEHPSICE